MISTTRVERHKVPFDDEQNAGGRLMHKENNIKTFNKSHQNEHPQMEVLPGVVQLKSLHNFCIKKLIRMAKAHRKSAGKLKQHGCECEYEREEEVWEIVMEFPSDSFVVCSAMPFSVHFW